MTVNLSRYKKLIALGKEARDAIFNYAMDRSAEIIHGVDEIKKRKCRICGAPSGENCPGVYTHNRLRVHQGR